MSPTRELCFDSILRSAGPFPNLPFLKSTTLALHHDSLRAPLNAMIYTPGFRMLQDTIPPVILKAFLSTRMCHDNEVTYRVG